MVSIIAFFRPPPFFVIAGKGEARLVGVCQKNTISAKTMETQADPWFFAPDDLPLGDLPRLICLG